uniref:Uncharacterized protein n=1 Tax=Opuntia streptacantha TaxID=393608 RepID=A0A7C9E9D0_OPUST
MSLFGGFSFNITGIFLSVSFQDSLHSCQWQKSLKRVQNLVLRAKWTIQELQVHLTSVFCISLDLQILDQIQPYDLHFTSLEVLDCYPSTTNEFRRLQPFVIKHSNSHILG